MLNPKEISDKRFDKSTFGYRAEDVDTFLKEVAFSYANLLKDYEQKEGKILALIEKINEYRDDEDAIKTAILGAQKQGRVTIAEAEQEATIIIQNATAKSEQLLVETKQKYSDEIQKLDILKKEVTAFKAKLSELYNKQLRLIMEIPDFDEDETVAQVEVQELKVEEPIIDIVEEIAPQAPQVAQDEQTSNFPYSKDGYNSNQSRFGDLRFGNKQNK